MAKITHDTYLSADKVTRIHWILWEPETRVRAVLQIVHGMQEFVERYDDFARFLTRQGFAVAANDHLGHGASVTSPEQYGYFADKQPNKAVIGDMRHLHKQLRERYPEVPYFLLGHSMGSFLAREYLCLYGQELDGAIISGTAFHPAAEAQLGKLLCSLIARRKGWHYRSPFVTRLAMGGYNKRFEPVRTPVDWLTRDEKVVDAYRSDARTQFLFTVNAFYGMFTSLRYLTVRQHLQRMPRSLPVFFIAGDMDPVGSYGAGVKRVVAQFASLGMQDVTCRLYPNDRHEVLNELNREEVYEDVLTWLNQHMEQSQS